MDRLDMAYLHTHPARAIELPTAPTGLWVLYTCLMHPQIRHEGPGNCPVCGMTRVPLNATAAIGPNRELANMTWRFWVGIVLGLSVFVLEMGGHIPGLGLDDLISRQHRRRGRFGGARDPVQAAGAFTRIEPSPARSAAIADAMCPR
jgi:hypothetical protein